MKTLQPAFVARRFVAIAAALFLTISGLAVAQAGQVEGENTIKFESVEQVFDAMEANQDAVRTDYAGWIIYNIANQGSYTLWSITPEDHPANPTAIRRDVVSRDGVVSIQMQTLCQASKLECEALIAEFKELNASIKRKMENGGNG